MISIDFSGYVSIVTGAAGGIGSGIARTFAEAGSHVILVDIKKEQLENLSTDLCAKGLDTVPASS